MAYEEPEFVQIWKKYPGQTPRCCFLCGMFNDTTCTCHKYKQVVPEDFARKIESCEYWVDKDGVPF